MDEKFFDNDFLDGEDYSSIVDNLENYAKRMKRTSIIEKWGICLSYLAPVVFIMNVPLALIVALWLLFTGGITLVIYAVLAYTLAPYAIGILTYPAKLISDLDSKDLSALLVAVIHWLVASVWGYIAITKATIYGASLSLPLFPTLTLCSAICTLPFFRILRDTLAHGSEEAGFICIIITAFIELASLISIIVFYFFSKSVTDIQIVTICTFIFVGIFAITVHCITLLGLSDEIHNLT